MPVGRTSLTTFIKSGLARFVRRFPHVIPTRLLRSLNPSNPRAQSFALEVALTKKRSTRKRRAYIDQIARHLPARDLVGALNVGRYTLFRTRIDAMSSAAGEPIQGLDFARAFYERRFLDAYGIWQEIPEVALALGTLRAPAPSELARTMAVVLPGPTDASRGFEIDHHDLVGRTSVRTPAPKDTESSGSRTDIAFLNVPRYRELCHSRDPLRIDVNRIVTDPNCRRTTRPSWLTVPVDFEMNEVETPAAPHSYVTLRIVKWCHAHGILPTLYCADFYLSRVPYQSEEYDPSHRLEKVDAVIRSYLTHDVFFTHAALQKWRHLGVIKTRGRLDELLDLDGHSFAGAIQDRWGSFQHEEDK